MKIIVDTSAIIAVVLGEKNRNSIIAATSDAELIAPSSVHWEIGNALSAMLKRERITLEQALKAIDIYQKIPIRFTDTSLVRAVEIANRWHIYAYDAYLVACALEYRIPLITLDDALARIAKNSGVNVVELAK